MSVYISALTAPRWAVTGGLALHVYLGHAVAFRGPGEERHFLSRQTSVENRAAVKKKKKKLAAGKKKKGLLLLRRRLKQLYICKSASNNRQL